MYNRQCIIRQQSCQAERPLVYCSCKIACKVKIAVLFGVFITGQMYIIMAI